MSRNIDESVDIEAIKSLYVSSEPARAILDYFASRRNDSTISKIDRIQKVLIQQGVSLDRRHIVEFFRSLEAAGCGRFISGRKGHPSRFEWAAGLVSVGKAASGEVAEVEAVDEELEAEDDDPDEGTITHSFVLRPGLSVTLDLPNDLTPIEAQRLSDYIKTLPFA